LLGAQIPQSQEIATPSTHGAECPARNDNFPFCLCEAGFTQPKQFRWGQALPLRAGKIVGKSEKSGKTLDEVERHDI
jgi:hypothetical protein